MRKIHHPLLKPLGPWTLWSEWTPCIWDEACPQGLLVQPTARAGRTTGQRSVAHLGRTGEEEENQGSWVWDGDPVEPLTRAPGQALLNSAPRDLGSWGCLPWGLLWGSAPTARGSACPPHLHVAALLPLHRPRPGSAP